MSNKNILILSVGTRSKIVQYFKKELNSNGGKVIAADSSSLAPALYEADKHYVIPRITEENYLDTIFKICKENNVGGVLSLIDPELSIISKNEKKFKENGILPIISDYDTVEKCFDKYEFYKLLTHHGIPTVKTFNNLEEFKSSYAKQEISFPVFVKPRNGSASLGIQVVEDMETLSIIFEESDEFIIQEYMDSDEYGVDMYVDMLSGELVSMFVKKKLLMRAGETDKSISLKNKKIMDLITQLVKKIDLKGIVDVDIFEKNGEYFVSEINPRFGGGYPHAYECGVNIPAMIVNNLNGKVNNINFNDYEEDIIMMKYNEVIIKNVGT